MKKIYVIRHGQCQANADRVICSRTDSPLTDTGRRQAKLAGQNAKKHFHFDLIIHSPLMRAADTARIIADELYPSPKLLQIEGLRERDLGEEEGRSYDYKSNLPADYVGEGAPGMESAEDLHDRCKKVLEMIEKRPENNILISCHNGIGRMLRLAARKGDVSKYTEEPRLENAVIYELKG